MTKLERLISKECSPSRSLGKAGRSSNDESEILAPSLSSLSSVERMILQKETKGEKATTDCTDYTDSTDIRRRTNDKEVCPRMTRMSANKILCLKNHRSLSPPQSVISQFTRRGGCYPWLSPKAAQQRRTPKRFARHSCLFVSIETQSLPALPRRYPLRLYLLSRKSLSSVRG